MGERGGGTEGERGREGGGSEGGGRDRGREGSKQRCLGRDGISALIPGLNPPTYNTHDPTPVIKYQLARSLPRYVYKDVCPQAYHTTPP